MMLMLMLKLMLRMGRYTNTDGYVLLYSMDTFPGTILPKIWIPALPYYGQMQMASWLSPAIRSGLCSSAGGTQEQSKDQSKERQRCEQDGNHATTLAKASDGSCSPTNQPMGRGEVV